MNKIIKLSEVSDLMLEVLNSGGEVSFITAGISMMPLLRDRCDKVFLSKPKQKPKKNDVVFYQRENGQYVLHRIISVKNGEYVLRGDNQSVCEYGITDKHIIAVAVAFERNGKHIKCSDLKYKLYCFFLPVIRFFRSVHTSVIRALRKLNQKRKRFFNKKRCDLNNGKD